MKKNIVSIVFVAAIAVAAAWNLSQGSNTGIELSDIALANVEALAADEDTIGGGNLGKRQEYMKGEATCCAAGIGLCSKPSC
jgi:hypothetical protein